MGNLPDSRTITINTGDPIPANLINEIQDQFAGDRRKQFKRPIAITEWEFTGPAPTKVVNPSATGPSLLVWRLVGGEVYKSRITGWEDGDILTAISFESYGDGAVDVTVDIKLHDLGLGDATGVVIASQTRNNDTAAWAERTITGSGLPRALTGPTAVLFAELSLSENNANLYHVGNFVLTMKR